MADRLQTEIVLAGRCEDHEVTKRVAGGEHLDLAPGAGLDLGSAQPSNDDTILVGYKGGNGETDSGYFYCPYIPLMSSGVVVNPVTFQPVVSLMTRYGKAVFTRVETSLGNSSDYYGKIAVNDLDLT